MSREVLMYVRTYVSYVHWVQQEVHLYGWGGGRKEGIYLRRLF